LAFHRASRFRHSRSRAGSGTRVGIGASSSVNAPSVTDPARRVSLRAYLPSVHRLVHSGRPLHWAADDMWDGGRKRWADPLTRPARERQPQYEIIVIALAPTREALVPVGRALDSEAL